jgi:hypothetical protein
MPLPSPSLSEASSKFDIAVFAPASNDNDQHLQDLTKQYNANSSFVPLTGSPPPNQAVFILGVGWSHSMTIIGCGDRSFRDSSSLPSVSWLSPGQ